LALEKLFTLKNHAHIEEILLGKHKNDTVEKTYLLALVYFISVLNWRPYFSLKCHEVDSN